MMQEKSLTSQLLQLSFLEISTLLCYVSNKKRNPIFSVSPISSIFISLFLRQISKLLLFPAMAMENRNGVVMGFPADYFETPRYEEPTIVTTILEPLPCNNPGEKLRSCVKWFILTLLIILMLFVLLAVTGFYLTYQNRAPIIQIESITPSNIASSNNTTISTNWHLTFSLENPNKYASIRYKKIQVSVSDKDKRLSSGNVDYFYQDKSEEGRMNVEIFGLVVNLKKQKMNDAGEMVFSLKLDAVVWLEKIYMKNHWQLLEANCGDVKVQPSMSLTFDGSGRCNVNLQ